MTTDTTDRLVADYLARLARVAAGLPPARRAELLEEIEAHIRSARAAGGPDDEASIRTLLDRLGTPEEIVAAAGDDITPATAVRWPWPALEITAFVLLTFGSFLLGVGWLAGVVLLWSSRRWRLGEKLLATLVVPGGPGFLPVLAIILPSQVCTSVDGGPETCTGYALPTWLGLPLVAVSLIGPFVIGGVLVHRALARAANEPPIPVRGGWGRRELAAVLLLGVGAVFLPVLAPIVGLALAWTSARWSGRDKLAATLVAVVPVVGGAAVLAFGAASAGIVLTVIAAVFAPIMAAVYLAITVDRSIA